MSKGKWQKITADQEILKHDAGSTDPLGAGTNGSMTAAAALEQALRTRPRAEEDVDDELARILSKSK